MDRLTSESITLWSRYLSIKYGNEGKFYYFDKLLQKALTELKTFDIIIKPAQKEHGNGL